MATTKQKLISTLKFLIFITLFTKSSSQSPNYVGDDCQNSTEQSLTTTYRSNLKKVLSLLSSDAIVSKGYNHTSIGGNTVDGVYGLYDCRGDVTGSFCQFCVSTAASDILQHCPNRASAVIWYNYCILRYSNHNFFGKLTTTPSWYILGTVRESS
ncbi:unnamed protein product [Vicia faba]|uniref:Gnk2-homologous domain-containing protein n=1 Tax=Vicia faba TaxID=3906 RepID=A0AAV0ZBV4_VICFA|nr:unnamed protein product [Vicia faba]